MKIFSAIKRFFSKIGNKIKSAFTRAKNAIKNNKRAIITCVALGATCAATVAGGAYMYSKAQEYKSFYDTYSYLGDYNDMLMFGTSNPRMYVHEPNAETTIKSFGKSLWYEVNPGLYDVGNNAHVSDMGKFGELLCGFDDSVKPDSKVANLFAIIDFDGE